MARGLCSRLARLIGLVAKTLSSFIKYRTVSRLLVSRRQSHARPRASRGLIAVFNVPITYSTGQGLNSHPICRVDRQAGRQAAWPPICKRRGNGQAMLFSRPASLARPGLGGLEFHDPGTWEQQCLGSRQTLGIISPNWQKRGSLASAVHPCPRQSPACRFLSVAVVGVEVEVEVAVHGQGRRPWPWRSVCCLVEPPQAVYPSICCRTRHGRAWAWTWAWSRA